jgi:arsenite methyltransferase
MCCRIQNSEARSQYGARKHHNSWKMLGHGGIAVLIFLLWMGLGYSQEHHPHHPMPLEQYLAILEDPKRDEWQKPEAVIEALNLQSGQFVADIGAGSGYFTLRLARAVGKKGAVFAVDVDKGMLDYLRQRLAKEQLQNVQVMLVPPHDPLLIDGSLDLVFMCNTYHHLEDREVYLRKLRKALKPDGRVVIVDFYKKDDMPVGPPPQMRLSEETVQQELQSAGLRVTETLTFLPYQYILIAQATTAAIVPSPAGKS